MRRGFRHHILHACVEFKSAEAVGRGSDTSCKVIEMYLFATSKKDKSSNRIFLFFATNLGIKNPKDIYLFNFAYNLFI